MNDIRLNVIVPGWLRVAAHDKARVDATDVSRIVRRLVWAWLRGEIDPYKFPDPPSSPE